NREKARQAAVGEVLERYSMLLPEKTRRMEAQSAEINGLEYTDYSWFHEEQDTDFENPEPGDEIEFLEGLNVQGERIFFPARLVLVNYRGKKHEDSNIGYPTSSGCAVARSPEKAFLKGLLEQIERSNALKAWFSDRDLKRIGSSQDDSLSRYAKSKGLKTDFIDITGEDGVPAVMGLCRGNGFQPAYSFSAELSMEGALKDARRELLQSCVSAQKRTDSDLEYREDAQKTQELLSRLKGETGNSESVVKPKEIIEHFGERSVLAFDISAPELESKSLKAVKTVVPDLIQFGGRHDMFLGNQEFRDNFGIEAAENKPPFLH
ncbi:MAG: YcaO-like family protein, partial [Candidatus Nanohaloarchaea archaeon]|nr:YcaO-like family protein [Candidatus Nanohaloarchaea archaeon]